MKYCAFAVWTLVFGIGFSATADVDGSADHPLITRYPASTIEWYEVQEFEPYKIPTGPITGYRTIDEWVETEGRITRIYYSLKSERSLYEVYSNYLNAIKKTGFSILTEGVDPPNKARSDIGGRTWLGVHYAENPIPPNGIVRVLTGSSTSGGSGYIAAKLQRPDDTVFVSLGAAQYSEGEVVVLLDIIEQKAMEDDLISVDAEAMSKDIDIYGKVALYGIFFDHNEATITPESKPALDEIAKLLKNRPALKVYVVGHTDMTGSLEYNLDLSKRRAVSVMDTLVEDYGIARERLGAQGVGPLVPNASNKGDSGRAKNRRVELVEM